MTPVVCVSPEQSCCYPEHTGRQELSTMTPIDIHTATVGRAASPQQRAAAAVYDAECALHAARQTGVPEWIEAAAARLVTAVERSLCITSHPCIPAAA